jgi:prefoldin subunit 5
MQPRPRRLSRKISGVHLGAEYTFQKNFRGALRRKKKKKEKLNENHSHLEIWQKNI